MECYFKYQGKVGRTGYKELRDAKWFLDQQEDPIGILDGNVFRVKGKYNYEERLRVEALLKELNIKFKEIEFYD